MFMNIGPMELAVLAIVGLIVLGPDRLPNLARDAARLIRQLREMATGARTTLRDELGPEFADLDLRNLNPRTALRNVLLGDDDDPAATGQPGQAVRPNPADTAPGGTAPGGTASLTQPPQVPGMGRTGGVRFDEDAT